MADIAKVNTVASPRPHESTHVSGGSDNIDSALAIAAMADLTTDMIWQGVAGRPVEVAMPSAGAPTNNGSYTGNDTVNRAIAHGLGVTPRLVIWIQEAYYRIYLMVIGNAEIVYPIAAPTHLAVTAADTTNFYVGNATGYDDSANENTKVYYWVAIG